MSIMDQILQRRQAAQTPAIAPKMAATSSTAYVGYNGSFKVNKAKIAVKGARDKIISMEARRDQLLEQKAQAERDKDEADRQLTRQKMKLVLAQYTSEYARQQARGRVEDLVSEALNVVYGGAHRFIIDLGVERGQPVTKYWLDDGEVLTLLEKPDYDRGGGKIDVITIALRLGLAELEGVTGPILLDEVGKHIDREAAVNVAYFLKTYCETMQKQIILITHNTDLEAAADAVIKVTRKNGIAEVMNL
jgi:DNA repair exonuclease SbcCD ATPase subunit